MWASPHSASERANTMIKKVLLVGAGAVGQVYGYHFQKAGIQVGFVVRPKYADDVRKGFNLYPMNRKNPRQAPVRFEGFDVHTDISEALAEPWDVVIPCLSSTALRKGDWFEALGRGIGEATLLNLMPGVNDLDYICQRVPKEQVVSGMIAFSSYPGPLENETLPEPGMVFWVPPMTKMPFSGPQGRRDGIIAALNSGGLKSKKITDATLQMAFAGPVLQFQMAALELSGWTFKGLRANKSLMSLTHDATREAHAIAAKNFEAKVPLALRALRPWMLRAATRLAPKVAPIDLELFFAKHFTKVGDQTEFGMSSLVDVGASLGVKTAAISALNARLQSQRALPGGTSQPAALPAPA